eukprot:1158484-Pelagomonas_calceolata.AAC.5
MEGNAHGFIQASLMRSLSSCTRMSKLQHGRHLCINACTIADVEGNAHGFIQASLMHSLSSCTRMSKLQQGRHLCINACTIADVEGNAHVPRGARQHTWFHPCIAHAQFKLMHTDD